MGNKYLLLLFYFCVAASLDSSAVEKFERLQKIGVPFLETYWESYASFPYGKDNCGSWNLKPHDVDDSAYGYDIKQVPEQVDIVNIAFAYSGGNKEEYGCERYSGCTYLVCGLHLYEKDDNSDLDRINQLKVDIKALQARGTLVKLAYGGEEWGNTEVPHKIKSLADYVAKEIVDHVNELGVDGIDLVQNQGYGTDNMNADDLSKFQHSLIPVV